MGAAILFPTFSRYNAFSMIPEETKWLPNTALSISRSLHPSKNLRYSVCDPLGCFRSVLRGLSKINTREKWSKKKLLRKDHEEYEAWNPKSSRFFMALYVFLLVGSFVVAGAAVRLRDVREEEAPDSTFSPHTPALPCPTSWKLFKKNIFGSVLPIISHLIWAVK